ncbi:hypothetical protein V4287_003697 [Serratia marcescens]|jgi:hypothetical protein|uniref:hypothetical protein n=1 Tax=Serratia marcescens TaxID=615 RepID=UPI0027528F26|nr:hypothetical protein [Serratia marcescens]MDP8705377.1 hypothetical protein [Serratia marcescens]HEJ7237841.1 hypothetical protein [Serratia marcescens]
MSTYGHLMISEIDDALGLIKYYTINGYSDSDIKNLLSKVASATELFLKRDVFPTKSDKDNFYSFIEELKNNAINQDKVNFIHAIRLEYNNAKHDPNKSISIVEIKVLLENLKLAIVDITALAIGRIASPVRATTTRVFWICAWDHYTGGATEVTIFLPSEYDGFLGAYSIDHVFIHGIKWDEFKIDVPNFGIVHQYEGLISEEQVDFWFSQGDCLLPLVFEGEYKSLIICLSKYLKDVDLIPGLAREDKGTNLLQIAVMAVSDAYANNPNTSKENQSIYALNLANSQYAILPKFNDRIIDFIQKVIDIVDKAPVHVKSSLTGPIWISKNAYEMNKSIYRDDTIRMLIDSNNRIALGIQNI